MKKQLTRLLSMALTVATLCSLAVLSMPIGAAAAYIDHRAIDFSSEEAFETNSYVYKHVPTDTQPDAYTGGMYSFSEVNSAMQIHYRKTANQPNYRLMFGFDQGHPLGADYKYMVVVYAAETDASYRMALWNSPKYGNEIVIAENGADTNGAWIVSEPFDISASTTGQSVLTRFMGSHNTLSIKSDDTDARFYIKELRFFKTSADAKAYYAGVSFLPLQTEVSDAASKFPRSAKTIDKKIVSFRDEDSFLDSGSFYNHTVSTAEPDPNTGGVYAFSAEKEALKLEYSENAKYAPYRVMTHLTRAKLTTEYKYFVVVYSVKSTANYSMELWNGGHWGENTVIARDAPSTGGAWKVSDAFDISIESAADKSVLTRWSKGSFNYLTIKTADKNAEIYIKEFGFFKSKEDAELYYSEVDLEQDPSAYVLTEEELKYGPEPETLPEPVIIDFSAAAVDLSQNVATVKFGASRVKLDDGKYAMKLTYSPSKSLSAYRMFPAFNSEDALSNFHRYVRVTYMTTETAVANLAISDASQANARTLTGNIAVSGGKWVTTNAVNISETDIVAGLNDGYICFLTSSCVNENAEIYIREIAFFATEEEAYAYYGDEYVKETVVEHSELIFGDDGNAAYLNGDTYGVHTENAEDSTLDISYAEKTNIAGTSYLAKIKFAPTFGGYKASSRFVRILYKAQNPDGAENVILRLRNDKSGADYVDFDRNVQNTDGYVLTDTKEISADMADRFASKMHNSIYFLTTVPGGLYKVKAVYFFNTEDEANAFTAPLDNYGLTINGNDISSYKIVVSAEASAKEVEAANTLATNIKKLTGTSLPVVTDDTVATAYELIVGDTTRPESDYYYGENGIYTSGNEALGAYSMKMDGAKVIFASNIPYSAPQMVDAWCSAYLDKGTAVDGKVALDSTALVSGTTKNLTAYSWAVNENIENPEVFYEDFSADNGYFTEESGEDGWKVQNGAYVATNANDALSYVHVYERNVRYEAKLTVTDVQPDADVALVLRRSSEHAYVKAGYDFGKSVWYIEERSGEDFRPLRREVTYGFTPGVTCEIGLSVDGSNAIMTVNGELMMMCEDFLVHVTPGQIGLYADGCTVSVDEVTAYLLSGEGTIWRDVIHTKLPDNVYREGGTVVEMKDGSLNYVHSSGTAFKSLDNGKTWQRTETWTTTTSYPNIFRLANGELMKIGTEAVDGVSSIVSFTSADEGKTWVQGGVITTRVYHAQASMSAGYMNDKLSQTESGRVFYCQNYQDQKSVAMNGYIQVFCEFYYSDDNGKTWTKSETDSFEIENNGTMGYFGECKIIETADGLRMYNSWSDYKYVAYSDSYDGGVTWGPLQFDYTLPTGRASMQLVRDDYSDTMSYYMLLVYNNTGRSRLSLFHSGDGKSWEFLGDVWRWESEYKNDGSLIAHIVDPFIKVTEDYIICGSGLSERTGSVELEGGTQFHQAQRQHIYSIKKASLPEASIPTSFTDVSAAASYSSAIAYVSNAGLFRGTSETTFSPATTMTRSMFVTVLGRLDGADVSKYTTPTFADVLAGQWYTSYVEWAAANGVVNGIGNGLYGIEQDVTVEQVCVMLARYNGNKSAEASGKTIADFTDSAAVSSWAADAVKWAVENGVYAGQGSKLAPTAPASRSLVATMFYNYVNVFGK